MGTLLVEMGFYTKAMEFLKHSVDLYGISPSAAYNLGICCYYLGELEPAFDAANVLRAELSGIPQIVAIRKRG